MKAVPKAGGAVIDGIRFEPTPGHTTGHMSIIVESNGHTAYFGGDLAHHPIQIYAPELRTVYCTDPDEAERSRRQVFSVLADTNTLFFSSHFVGQPVGRIGKADHRFAWKPL